MYVDMEKHALAIEAFEKAIDIHSRVIESSATSATEAKHMSMVPDQLEKVGIMKILAEQYIVNNQIDKGIETAENALILQKVFFSNMINDQVQETILLLAEAYTVRQNFDKAIESYTSILDARQDASGMKPEANKDIYRKMAACFTAKEQFPEANECLSKVMELED